MSRLRFWLRWSARDLRSRWLLVLAIALVIAIGTGIYSGLGSMENWRKESNDASFAALNAHDLELSLTEGTLHRDGSLGRLVRSIPESGQVAALEERLSRRPRSRSGAPARSADGPRASGRLATGRRRPGDRRSLRLDRGRALRSAD